MNQFTLWLGGAVTVSTSGTSTTYTVEPTPAKE
jgi:hypothetical protein